MKRRLALILWTASWLAGCATYPLPLIDGNTYTNPEYAFSVALPDDWHYADDPPAWLKDRMPASRERAVVVTLVNRDTTGFILISGAKFDYGIDTAEEREELRLNLVQTGEKQRMAAVMNPDKSYFFRVHPVESSVEPRIVFNELITTQNDFMLLVIHSSSYLYLCETDHTCGMDIVLISDAKTFDHNNAVYQRLLASISGIKRPVH